MAALIGSFRERHPGVQVREVEPGNADGVARSCAKELRAGTAPLPFNDDGLEVIPLPAQELMFVLPPGSLAADVSALGAGELAHTPLVVQPPGHLHQDTAGAGAGRCRRDADDRRGDRGAGGDRAAGARGRGRRAAAGATRYEAGRRGAIVRAGRPAIMRRVGLIHRERPLSPAARAFAAIVSQPRPTRSATRRPPAAS